MAFAFAGSNPALPIKKDFNLKKRQAQFILNFEDLEKAVQNKKNIVLDLLVLHSRIEVKVSSEEKVIKIWKS
jgi:hypothetical protein